ncbi:MAG: sulfite exporter TauE/SafE family protein [Patescibacteria group bacterium]|nr:sulfite exporter TauE/SafE family protein [Patescibacteria group bacterium]
MLQKIKIKIEGLHCSSCKTLIETRVATLPGVKSINVDYQAGRGYVEFREDEISQEIIFKTIKQLNYKVSEEFNSEESSEPKRVKGSWFKKLTLASLFLILFLLGYFLVQKFGGWELLARLNEKNLSYGLIFLIGFLASFHCIGMCGGLVVAYTTHQIAKSENRRLSSSHLQYNLGRLISYTAIGAILGGFGSFFGINPTFTGIMTLSAAGFMIIMGLSLLTNFRWLQRVKLKTPAFIARFLYRQNQSRRPKGPFIIGLLNGLMPCGPLQAMQLYALASGSAARGALSLGIYALGTIPLMFGLGSFVSLLNQEKIKWMMKFSGVVVIILGLLMFNRGLAGFGKEVSTPNSSSPLQEPKVMSEKEGYQTVKMDLTYRGYVPNVLYVQAGVPVRWVIDVKQMSGCTKEILVEKLGISRELQYGENVIEFTPREVGEIKFSCGMKMVWGKFIVTKEAGGGVNSPDPAKSVEGESSDNPRGTGGGCGCGSQ